MAVVHANALSKRYKKQLALDEVTFSVDEGEIFGLLGPSGAGKTTLLKILTGQLRTSGGSATVLGVDSSCLSANEYDNIGIMLEDCGLYARLSCYSNLKIFSLIHKKNPRKIDDILLRVGLSESKNKKVSDLSRGMLQRLSLANAILHSPKLVLLDEPTSALDPATAKGIRELILDLRKDGATIVMTTHNMNEAMALCDDIVLLDRGRIIEHGNPASLCKRYDEGKVNLTLNSGETLTLSMEGDANLIAKYVETKQVQSIHSLEQNLEDIFIHLTGRGL